MIPRQDISRLKEMVAKEVFVEGSSTEYIVERIKGIAKKGKIKL